MIWIVFLLCYNGMHSMREIAVFIYVTNSVFRIIEREGFVRIVHFLCSEHALVSRFNVIGKC